jgi:hypothetical protein
MSNSQCPACRGRSTKWTTTPPGLTDSSAANQKLPDLPAHLMARDLSEAMGGKYPVSLHAPLCEDYKQMPFTRVEVDGLGCIVPESEAAAVIDGLGDEEY